MQINHIQVVTELIHQIRFNLRVDRLESWSDALEGLSLLDLHILKLTAEKPDIILKDIRETLDIPHSTLTSAINRLEQQDLLKRVINQRDLRSFGLELTQKGCAIREEHDRMDHLIGKMVLETLADETERETLIQLLSKINQRLG